MGTPGASLVSAPWGGGARGSSEPTGQEEGSSVAGEEGGQLGPPRRGGFCSPPLQTPSSK